ncbi:MAG: hypothetical protein RLZZ244_1001 [Verrucomicrobiota bacterium]|jgi:hypothetical protein
MSIGFKEWALVCEALGSGRQSVILRKGGIAEGREGFRFQHREFLLMPTLFHEQVAKLKLPPETPLPPQQEGWHRLRFRVEVEWTRELTDWETVRRLDPFHCWTEATIRERFVYDDKQSVSLAFLRVYRLREPLEFADAPKYGGCRSWVSIPDWAQTADGEAVLEEGEHRAREQAVRAVLE